MKRRVIRVYDKNEKYTNTGKCFFLILPEDYNPENPCDYEKHVYLNLIHIACMSWQSYTSFLEGTADISENEMFWSEITGYTLKECKIDIDRVEITGRYKLPEELF